MSNPRVFISYSHDSSEHSERVLKLAWALRGHGIDVELDQFHNEEIVDWPRWCRQQIKRKQSDFVLCICTAEYQRRIEGDVPPEKGKGVYWEGSLLDDEMYNDKGNRRLIPVLFDAESESCILDFLRGWTLCRLSEFELGDPGYEHLLRILLGKVKVEKNALGSIPDLPTQRAPDNSSSGVAGVERSEPPADGASHETPNETGGSLHSTPATRIINFQSKLPRTTERLIGREAEMAMLDDAWNDPHRNVVVVRGKGGEGKTSLVASWMAELAMKDWRGAEWVLDWSFYSQGTRDQSTASGEAFIISALGHFGDEDPNAGGPNERGARLARLVGERRGLLVLDGLEPLQYPPGPLYGQLHDKGVAALLKGLAGQNAGLCVVTTREKVDEIQQHYGRTAIDHSLEFLSPEAGAALLHHSGRSGPATNTRSPPMTRNCRRPAAKSRATRSRCF